MKLPQIVTDSPVKIDQLVPGGQGIATTAEGIKGFFWNALPGETVKKYEITKKKSHYFLASALEIENPSSHRIEPKDSCYLSTSPWQIMDYPYELDQKSKLLAEVFRQNKITLEEPVVATDSKDFYYRNKMEYSLYFDYETEKLSLGFHQRGTHRKIKVETSSIERPEIFKKASEIVAELNAKKADGRKYQSLLLRSDQNGKVEGGFYENRKPHPVFSNLTDQILGKTYSYSPNGFFQINLPVYEMALEEIKKHIKTEEVLDLYAGVGTIGLSVASDKDLTLVEVDKSAYQELENNAKNHKTILEKSENITALIKLTQTVIVDPPRAGLDQKLIEKFLETPPETIIYLSCNPATQARDVRLLLGKYQIVAVKPFNFFPRTPHLENLIILERK
ncbi:class I SAM-dependent RNA methyltransferase [Candidatus Saccharibacteria bacterium]|nr:class I SAM-dependent RNA methyltransferase [Candidatus Saccharibacteria bacterium]